MIPEIAGMAKVNLRVRHEGGHGVVKGLDPSDSIEKLISHCIEVLGVQEIDVDAVRMLSGFPPKALDLSDRDRNIESLGVRSGDTIILENLKPSTSSSTSSSSSPSGFAFGPALTAKSESVTDSEGATGAKRQKTELNAARYCSPAPARSSCYCYCYCSCSRSRSRSRSRSCSCSCSYTFANYYSFYPTFVLLPSGMCHKTCITGSRQCSYAHCTPFPYTVYSEVMHCTTTLYSI